MAPRVGPNRTALVTDDDALIRRVVGMALESDGWAVIEAADAQAERAALEGCAVDLCVMDRHLPGPDLDARIDEVGRLRPDAAVLVLSGDPAAATSGVVQLAKPVDLDTFRRGVERAVDLARARA
jgi:DNA-binding NtrC family response regulator